MIERMLQAYRRPILMLFEDLQWAGSESLRVLLRLSERVGQYPLLLLCSSRDDEQTHIAEQLSAMQQLRLRRLNDDNIVELSAAMLGEAGRLPHVVDLLRRETEGNIFFVIEVVRALAEEIGNLDEIGRMTLPPRVFTGGIKTVIQRRLSRLDAFSQDVLKVAAVMGRELNLRLLQRIHPNLNVDTWLATCANAAVIEAEEDRWHFTHDKLREALTDELSPQQHRLVHQRVAEALEREYGTESNRLAALAYHWGQAGQIDREEHYVTLAGEYALRTGAYAEALEFLQRAQKLVDALNISQERRDRKHIHLNQRLAATYLGQGNYSMAQRLHAFAYTLCEALGDEVGIAVCLGHLGDVAMALDQFGDAHDLYERSLALFRHHHNAAGVARALNQLGNASYELGDDAEAKRLFQASLDIAREAGQTWGAAGAMRNNQPVSTEQGTSLQEPILVAQLHQAVATSDTPEMLRLLYRLARLWAQSGRGIDALIVLNLILNAEDSPDSLQDSAESALFELQDNLDAASLEAAWEDAKRVNLQDVLTQLLA